MKERKLFLIIPVLFIMLAALGCGKKEIPPDSKRLIAKINKCEISVADFQDDARLVLAEKYTGGDPEQAKEDLLDEIVIKKILLQEAQARNYDKNRAFMKEIERYWEQALLKLLIKEKMQELLQKMSVRDDEIAREYEIMKFEEGKKVLPYEKALPIIRSDIRRKKVSEAFSQWITSLKRRANIKIYKENFKYINID